jgi:RNA polymerase sigma factor (sigma-70 family)
MFARRRNNTPTPLAPKNDVASVSTITALTDVELLEQVRKGDEAAFTELFVRHRAVARRVALTYRCPGDPDDLVNEAFEKVFAAVRRGHGPTDAFRAYLLVTMRRLAADHSERPRDDRLDDVPDAVAAAAAEPPIDREERSLVTRAFESLPDRWQAVLWYTAVEGRNPRELAPLLGVSANAVSALAYRAREQLRQAYLQAHLQTWTRPQCEPHRSLLGAYVRDGQSRRDRAATQRHLDTCESCQGLVAELNEVNSLLVRSVVPLFPAALLAKALPVAAAAGAGAGGAAGATGAGAGGAAHLALVGEGTAKAARKAGSLTWVKEATATAGGLVAATGLLVGLVGMGAYVSGDHRGEPDVAMLIDSPGTTLAPTTTAAPVTTAPPPPAELAGAQPCPASSTLGLDVGGGGSTGAGTDADAAAENGDAAVDDEGNILSLDVDVPLLDELASGLVLEEPLCTATAPDRGELSVGLGTADEALADTTLADVDLELLDIELKVELAGGATAVDLGLPDLCEVSDDRRSVVCAVDSLTPANIGLLLDTAGADAGATISVTQNGETIDVRTVDVLSQVDDLTGGLLDGLAPTSATSTTATTPPTP